MAQATNAQGDLETLLGAPNNLVVGVGIDLSGSVATLDVIAEDGYEELPLGTRVSDATIVEEELEAILGSMYFEGVPLEVSTIQTVDLSKGSSWGN